MPNMTIELKAFLVVFTAVFLFGLGFYTKGKFDAPTAIALKAETANLEQCQKAQLLNNQAETDYENSADFISTLYDGVQQPAAKLPVPALSRRTCPSPASVSRAYHLTPRQCDNEESKLISVWQDWQAQGKN